MNLRGILVGIISFASIGLFHPIVIKSEYYFSKKCWPVFLICGVVLLAASAFIESTVFSSIVAVVGFSCLWSILELYEQEKRVEKGWFPANPNRKK